MSGYFTPENGENEKAADAAEAASGTAVKKNGTRRGVPPLTAVVAVLLAVLLTALGCALVFIRLLADKSDELGFLKKVRQLDALYRSEYVGDIDYDKVTDSLLYAYIAAIDRYGYYLNKEDYDDMMNKLTSTGVGLGIYVVGRENGVEIQLVMEDTPAESAGLSAGDIIYAVGDARFADMTYDEFIAACRGEIGTKKTVYYIRDGEEHSVEITYASYSIQTVVVKNLGGGVGYIYITSFESGTAQEFKRAVESLKMAGCGRLVFDVRNNSGGLLDSVTEMLDFVMGSGVIATVTDSKGNVVETYRSDAFDAIEGMRCAVLINSGTASAAELFSCALRDSKGTLLVGENSFGKGTMQHILSLGDGTGVGITTHFYNPPSTPNYDGVGLKPDIEVGMPEGASYYSILNMPYEYDAQLRAAVAALSEAE